MRESLCRGSDRLVVLVDQLGHERGHGVGIERLASELAIDGNNAGRTVSARFYWPACSD